MNDLPEIEDIKRLNLGPDDVLVVRCRGLLTREAAERISIVVRANLPLDNKVLVLDDGTELEVITPDQAADTG